MRLKRRSKRRLGVVERAHLREVKRLSLLKLEKILLNMEIELLNLQKRDAQAAAWVQESRKSK